MDGTIDVDGIKMVRLPFVYYNPEKLAEIKKTGGKIDETVMYSTKEYTAPKKGFKLHPACKRTSLFMRNFMENN